MGKKCARVGIWELFFNVENSSNSNFRSIKCHISIEKYLNDYEEKQNLNTTKAISLRPQKESSLRRALVF